jgi:hypothetical protein
MSLTKCPLCRKTFDEDDPDFCYPMTRPDEEGNQRWWAGCTESCGKGFEGDSKEEVMTNWNTLKELHSKLTY